MNGPNSLSKLLTTAALGGLLFFSLVVMESRAQSDKDRPDSEQSKPIDNSFIEGERQEVNRLVYEKKSLKANPYPETVIRDNSGYRVEGQREVKEEGKSTFSFNIFLYVLERYKEN